METTEETTKESAKSTVKTAEPNAGLHPFRTLKKSVTWQRITISLLGILIMVGIWQLAVWHLYSIPETSVSAFTTITVNCFYAIAALVLFFVTGKLIYDLKVDTVSQVITHGTAAFEHREEHSVHEEIIVDETAKNENNRVSQEDDHLNSE